MSNCRAETAGLVSGFMLVSLRLTGGRADALASDANEAVRMVERKRMVCFM